MLGYCSFQDQEGELDTGSRFTTGRFLRRADRPTGEGSERGWGMVNRPNKRVEPTALSGRLVGGVLPGVVVLGRYVLLVSGGGSRASR